MPNDPIVTAAVIAAIPASLTVLLQLLQRRQTGNIKAKVDETHHQMTTNHHQTDPPTILDRIDGLGTQVQALTEWAARHEQAHKIERELRRD